jgi:hypothetical protein
MAKHGRKREIVSLVSFIQTGELGPMKLGMPMREVSELLGPPDWWMDGYNPDTSPVPLLWGYNSRILEVFFTQVAPHVVECIKVTQLPLSKQRHLRIRWGFWIRADGIHDEMKISDLLRLPIWEGREATVGMLCSDANIDSVTDKVELLRHMWDDDWDAIQQEVESGLPKAGYVARRDELSTGFHGIYSRAEPRSNRFYPDKWEEFSAQDYLALIACAEERSHPDQSRQAQ